MNTYDEKGLYIRRWIITFVFTLLIFASLPIFPTIWYFFSRLFPDILKGVTSAITPLFVFLFFAYFIFIKRKKDSLFYLWSAVFLFSYWPLVYFYCEFPAERLHMAEYGLLVIFVYRALKVRIKTVWIYLPIILYTFFVGLLDEIIQGILPNRVYEFKDITINWASSFLATCLLAGCTWQRFTHVVHIRRFRKWSMVIISMVLVGNIVLF
ncbi:MAG: VanZ family protein, partial [Deltaproteobacteria bacterium]|nr:VanZ family protein [Deltaproteobacteria bacterium]